jgi:hypothetical protein
MINRRTEEPKNRRTKKAITGRQKGLRVIVDKFFCFLVFTFLVSFYLSGCAYTTSGISYPEKNIYIAPVLNKISITDESRTQSNYWTFPILLENTFTNNLINKFNVDGHFKVAADKDTSDSLNLSCVINNYAKETLRYSDSDDVVEERLRLTAHIKVIGGNGKPLIEKDVVGEATYFLSGPKQKSETTAQGELIDDTARRILEAVAEEW